MKEAFEKMTGMPDAWTNPALMVSRNAFIQGWEAAQTEHDADATIIQYHEATIKRLEKRIEELAQPAQQERVQTDSLADIGAAYKDIHACLTETLQLSRKQNGHPRQPAQEPIGTLNLGGIINTSEGLEYDECDIDLSDKTIDALQKRLVTCDPVTLNIYTTPQQRPWVDLTEDEMDNVRRSMGYNQFMSAGEYAKLVQFATQTKLKEKNNG
jgi:hypothetical protein